MFKPKSKTYKLNPGLQIIEGDFVAGYVVEELDVYGNVLNQTFSNLSKSKLIDRLKDVNGFKTKGEQMLDQLLEEID